jgi:SMC interacting uncharacterized protein involved in chromosome segregation
MNPALQPFLTVALPIITIVLAMWTNSGHLTEMSARMTDLRSDMNQRLEKMNGDFNRRFETLDNAMNRRFNEMTVRLDRMERKLDSHEERIVRLDERTSPIHR